MRMRSAQRFDPVETLMQQLDGSATVSGIVPRGYARYVRIFSPLRVRSSNARDALELRVPWRLVCDQLGIELGPNTLWQRDIVTVDPRVAEFQEPGIDDCGSGAAERVGRILHEHEPGDRSWHFASWVGFGVEQSAETVWFPSHYHDALEMSVFERWNEASAPFVTPRIPMRAEGSASLAAFGHAVGPSLPVHCTPPGTVPMYWWPDGGDWVLGHALYGRTLYLACGDSIADALLSAQDLEVIEVDPADEAEYEE